MYVIIDSDSGSVMAVSDTPISMSGHQTYVVDENEDIRINPEHYKMIGNQIIKDEEYFLEMSKKNKSEELNIACKESILAGFKHTINGIEYHFSFDFEAQMNFQGAERLLSQNLIPEIMWTVQKDGEYTRIPINKTIMNELMFKILLHKDSNISRYRDFFMPIVEGCETVEELNSIQWKVGVEPVLPPNPDPEIPSDPTTEQM